MNTVGLEKMWRAPTQTTKNRKMQKFKILDFGNFQFRVFEVWTGTRQELQELENRLRGAQRKLPIFLRENGLRAKI